MAAASVAATVQAAAQSACKPAPLDEGIVQAIADGRAVRLTNGRTVRLAGVEIPRRDGGAIARAVGTALETALTGRKVTLWRLGASEDRYGRVVALVSAEPRGAAGPIEITQTVQWLLLSKGLARVAARVGDAACARELLAIEQAARGAGLGLWADPYYVISQAEDPARILAARGHFAVIEGTVLSVRESGSIIYVNFGRRWSDDFTVTVPKRNERTFTAAGLNLKALASRRVRVRGTVEERGGPWIEVTRPEQIEIAESQ
jgi:endonuclease YncB( thermonuclease family)